jgi:hypothetical protein
VPGALDMEPALRDAPGELVTCHCSKARRITSVCAGAFLLADAGLLNGRRATTHWASSVSLGERYPSLKVEPDAIFVRDDPIWTSAGVSAGIDPSLAMVQDDCGHSVAMQVARQLVVYMKRPVGQSQQLCNSLLHNCRTLRTPSWWWQWRRSDRCKSSWLASWTSAENSFAGDWPGSTTILPPIAHTEGRGDALLELNLDALGKDEIDQPLPVLGDAVGVVAMVFMGASSLALPLLFMPCVACPSMPNASWRRRGSNCKPRVFPSFNESGSGSGKGGAQRRSAQAETGPGERTLPAGDAARKIGEAACGRGYGRP